MSNNILYNEHFQDSLVNMLRNNKYYVYCSGIQPIDITNPEIAKRANISNGILSMTRLQGDKDFTNTGLNPRFEFVPFGNNGQYYNTESHMHLTADVFFDDKNLSSTFIQIAGRNDQGQGKPIFVLDTYRSKVNARCRDFKNDAMVRNLIANYEDVYNKWNKFDIFWYATNKSSGYFYVFLNGIKVFEKIGQTYWNSMKNNMHTTYGLYATENGSHKQTIKFKSYCVQKYNNKPVFQNIVNNEIDDEKKEELKEVNTVLCMLPSKKNVKLFETLNKIAYTSSTLVYNSKINLDVVEFYINNQFIRKESNAPYVISGDNRDGTFNIWKVSKNIKYDIKIVGLKQNKVVISEEFSILFN
jgi:hypothetical protein